LPLFASATVVMKVFFRRIHLYLGLAAGLVILIACLTGAILVFEKDLQMAFNEDRYYVNPQGQRLSLDVLTQRVKDSFPTAKVSGVKLYSDPKRSAEVNISLATPKENNAKGNTSAEKKGPPARQPGYTIFVNPYTGQILEKYSYRETWYYTVFALHRWLLGSSNGVGKLIVGVSTLVFLFILITGIILWWPKTKKILKQRLKVKWNAGWKRVNHDMHIVLGFYSAIFLFIFAFTGLAWSFKWFEKGIYSVTNSSPKRAVAPPSVNEEGIGRISLESALASAKTVYADAQFYNVSQPKDSSESIQVTALRSNPAHESATDIVFIDQYSGNVTGKQTFEERSLGDRVRSSFKPIHTGSIWGTPSKIVAFIVCLLGVTFPVTGVILWINRTRKKKKSVSQIREVEEVAYAD